MTKDLSPKDWFAGMAMQVLMEEMSKTISIHVKSNAELKQAIVAKAAAAYDWAEVMMREREKREAQA
jgi:hypothetical protein